MMLGNHEAVVTHQLWIDTNGEEGAQLKVHNWHYKGADLRGTILDGASFEHAAMVGTDLRDCSLVGADLRRCSFVRADLRHANLRMARVDRTVFRDADLRCADLTGVDLHGLLGTDLIGARMHGISGLPAVENFDIDRAVADAVGSDGQFLSDTGGYSPDVKSWASWTVALHPQGRELTSKLGFGVYTAASIIYARCSRLSYIPDWHAIDDVAIREIRGAI